MTNFLLAQNQTKIDSLLEIVKTNISTNAQVDIYIEIVKEYKNSDSTNTIKYANKAIDLANQIDDEEGIINAWVEVAWMNLRLSHYFEAEQICKELIKKAEKVDYQTGEAAVLNILGILNKHKGNYEIALDYHFQSLKISEKIRNKKEMTYAYHNIGNIYIDQENYKKALEYNFKSLEIKEEMRDKRGMANSYNNIGVIYDRQGNYEAALDYYHRSLDLREALGDKYGLGSIYNNFGMVYKNQGNYEKALEYSFKSLHVFEEIGAHVYLSYPTLTIAEIYLEQEEWGLAKDYLNQGLQLSIETNNIENIKNAAEGLSDAEKALGNYKAAYEAHVLFKEMADSLKNEEMILQIVQNENEYEFEQKKDSIQFVNTAEKFALEKNIEKRRFVQIATSISLGLLGLSLLILFLFLRSKLKSNKLLTEKSQELESMNIEVLQQAEEIKILNKALEQNLDKTTNTLLYKNKKLSEYAFMNSHELRSPIVRLLGLISILETDHIDKDVQFILQSIQINVQELDEITRKMNIILEEGSLLKED